jgi:hypothetical protein
MMYCDKRDEIQSDGGCKWVFTNKEEEVGSSAEIIYRVLIVTYKRK